MKRKIHLQTMHSWFGLITILIFTLYCIGNFYLFFKQIPLQTNKNNFLRPKKRQKFLKKLNQLLLLVRLLGLGCLIMAMITSILGLNQYEDFYNGFQKSSSSLSDIEYNTSNPSSPKLLTNIVAIFLIIYCGFMSYLIARQRYRSSESIEFEQQVEQAVERAMKKMDAKGAFKSKNRTKRLSMRSDQSLSRIKSNGIQNFRSSGGGAFGVNDETIGFKSNNQKHPIRSPRLTETTKFDDTTTPPPPTSTSLFDGEEELVNDNEDYYNNNITTTTTTTTE